MSNLWDKISKSDRFIPARIRIPDQNIDSGFSSNESFQTQGQYFLVTVNELYLSYSRKWFKDWDPFVFVTTKFLYDGVYHEVPFFVGQKMLADIKQDIPSKGMIFENTKVVGLHPFKGGDFSLTILLGRSIKNNYLQKVMNVIEQASKTYLGAYGTAILPYLEVGKLVMNSFEDLLNSKDVEPLIGYRSDYNASVDAEFKPGYFALINQSESEVDSSNFFIKNKKLHYGNSLENSIPYRQDDYVLYSILSTKKRKDLTALPFYKGYKETSDFIANFSEIPDDTVKTIKGKIFSFLNQIRLSPDLTRAQAKEVANKYKTDLLQILDERRNFGAHELHDQRDDWEREMDNAITSVLD